MILAHKTPCNVCPFLRTSAAGWLGKATPEEFIGATLNDVDMPCHANIDYERKGWRKRVAHGPRCAGSLVFLRNSCKLPLKEELREARNAVTADYETVFRNRYEFLDHHQGRSA